MEWIKINNQNSPFELPEMNESNTKELKDRTQHYSTGQCSEEVIIMAKGYKRPMTGFLCIEDDPQAELFWEIIGIGDASFEDITHWRKLPEPPKDI